MKMFLVTCLLLGVSTTQAIAMPRTYDCGGMDYLNQNNGVIVSHGGFNAGHTYGKNINCIWRIEAAVGQYVELVAQSFDVEDDIVCSYDYLTLFDGNSTNSPDLGKFCGTRFNPITSTGRFLTLQFTTDDDTQKSGFSLFYNFTNIMIHTTCRASEFQCENHKCIEAAYRCDTDDDCGDDSDEKYCNGTTSGGGRCYSSEFKCGNGKCVSRSWLCDGDDDCDDNTDELQSNCNAVSNETGAICGATNLTGDAGNITSPNYPKPYSNDASCIYHIHAPQGTRSLAFKFSETFSMEADIACSYDFVKVFSDEHSFTHGPFCGNISPGQFTMPGDHAYIQFVSDDNDNYSGFNLEWKALQ